MDIDPDGDGVIDDVVIIMFECNELENATNGPPCFVLAALSILMIEAIDADEVGDNDD